MNYPTLSGEALTALTRIWQKATQQEAETATWEADMKHVYKLGLGMQELLQYLYEHQPDLESFVQWALIYTDTKEVPDKVSEDVLSPADLEQWQRDGYIVIRNAVTPDECVAAAESIWEFLGANLADEESWYRPHPARNGMMVVFTQHPALQTIRNSARIRRAYEQLYGTTAIYKIVDKVSFNPPEKDYHTFAGSPLHWDTSLELPIPDRLQGLLYLSGVTAEGGAFQCVPGFHRQIGQWMESVPAGADVRQYALKTLQPIPVPGNAGDFIIWHQALPHCASPNRSNQPRLVQYLTYLPDHYKDQRRWK